MARNTSNFCSNYKQFSPELVDLWELMCDLTYLENLNSFSNSFQHCRSDTGYIDCGGTSTACLFWIAVCR